MDINYLNAGLPQPLPAAPQDQELMRLDQSIQIQQLLEQLRDRLDQNLGAASDADQVPQPLPAAPQDQALMRLDQLQNVIQLQQLFEQLRDRSEFRALANLWMLRLIEEMPREQFITAAYIVLLSGLRNDEVVEAFVQRFIAETSNLSANVREGSYQPPEPLRLPDQNVRDHLLLALDWLDQNLGAISDADQVPQPLLAIPQDQALMRLDQLIQIQQLLEQLRDRSEFRALANQWMLGRIRQMSREEFITAAYIVLLSGLRNDEVVEAFVQRFIAETSNLSAIVLLSGLRNDEVVEAFVQRFIAETSNLSANVREGSYQSPEPLRLPDQNVRDHLLPALELPKPEPKPEPKLELKLEPISEPESEPESHGCCNVI